MNEVWISVLETVGLAWWVEIVTNTPACTYYFGPFSSAQDAEALKPGYIQDLDEEGAQELKVMVKRCKPPKLTIFDENEKSQLQRISPSFSS